MGFGLWRLKVSKDSEDELENYSSDEDIEIEHGVSGNDDIENSPVEPVNSIPQTNDVSIPTCPDMSSISKKVKYRNILWSKTKFMYQSRCPKIKFLNFLFCDNYYISIPLLVHMARNGSYVTCTARRNSI